MDDINRYRITIIEHAIKTPGDAHWEYRVRDMKAPKGRRIIQIGCRTTAIQALNAAIDAKNGHRKWKALGVCADAIRMGICKVTE